MRLVVYNTPKSVKENMSINNFLHFCQYFYKIFILELPRGPFSALVYDFDLFVIIINSNYGQRLIFAAGPCLYKNVTFLDFFENRVSLSYPGQKTKGTHQKNHTVYVTSKGLLSNYDHWKLPNSHYQRFRGCCRKICQLANFH